MDENFRQASLLAKDRRIRRFISAHRFSLRVGTHRSQVHSQVVSYSVFTLDLISKHLHFCLNRLSIWQKTLLLP